MNNWGEHRGISVPAVAAMAWLPGLAIVVEKKSRRMELALYCTCRVRPINPPFPHSRSFPDPISPAHPVTDTSTRYQAPSAAPGTPTHASCRTGALRTNAPHALFRGSLVSCVLRAVCCGTHTRASGTHTPTPTAASPCAATRVLSQAGGLEKLR